MSHMLHDMHILTFFQIRKSLLGQSFSRFWGRAPTMAFFTGDIKGQTFKKYFSRSTLEKPTSRSLNVSLIIGNHFPRAFYDSNLIETVKKLLQKFAKSRFFLSFSRTYPTCQSRRNKSKSSLISF